MIFDFQIIVRFKLNYVIYKWLKIFKFCFLKVGEYDVKFYDCCNGQILKRNGLFWCCCGNMMIDYDKKFCCVGKGFNKRNKICCGGK